MAKIQRSKNGKVRMDLIGRRFSFNTPEAVKGTTAATYFFCGVTPYFGHKKSNKKRGNSK